MLKLTSQPLSTQADWKPNTKIQGTKVTIEAFFFM